MSQSKDSVSDSDSSSSSSWVFIDDNASQNKKNKYYLNCSSEPVQELTEKCLNSAGPEVETDSDGISIISESDDTIEKLQAIEGQEYAGSDEVNERNIIETIDRLPKQDVKTTNKDNDHSLVGSYVFIIGIVSLALLLPLFFSDQESSVLSSDLINDEHEVEAEFSEYDSDVDLDFNDTEYDELFHRDEISLINYALENIQDTFSSTDEETVVNAAVKHEKERKNVNSKEIRDTGEQVKKMEKHVELESKNKKIKMHKKEKYKTKDRNKEGAKKKFLEKKSKQLEKMLVEKIKKKLKKDKIFKSDKRKKHFCGDNFEKQRKELEAKEKFLRKKEELLEKKEKEFMKQKVQILKEYESFNKNKKGHKNYFKKLIVNDGKVNKSVSGEWYNNLYNERNRIRSEEQSANWMFDRAVMRKNKRNKALWYFNRMTDREELRSRRKECTYFSSFI